MLLSREEMSYDFAGAKLDPKKDRKLLGWVFNQFLYGEVTGIQVGHWLYGAPDIAAAKFFARQAVEEMQHVDNFLTILKMIDEPAKKPHAALRFLATGMMGQNFEEHVTLEMAMGEGQVLMALYALIDTLDDKDIVAILERAVKQEERHVDFGEQRTIQAVQENPKLRTRLLGLSLVSLFGVEQLGAALKRFLPSDHPVLKHMPDFLKQVSHAAELRLMRMGLVDRPLSSISVPQRIAYVGAAYGAKAIDVLLRKKAPARLTETYLADSHVRSFGERDGKGANLSIV